MSFWSAVRIVARREIVTRLQSKGFVIPTLVTVGLLLLVGVVGPQAVNAFSSDTTVAVTNENVATIDGLGEDFEALPVSSDAAAREAVETEDANAALITAPDAPRSEERRVRKGRR